MITYKYREDSVVKYMTDTAINHGVWDILSVQFTHTHTKKQKKTKQNLPQMYRALWDLQTLMDGLPHKGYMPSTVRALRMTYVLNDPFKTAHL